MIYDREPNLLSGADQFQMCEPSTAKQRQEVAEIMALLAEVITFTSRPILDDGGKTK